MMTEIAEKTKIREYHEWIQMRWLNEDNDTLPRVLLVGDSIVAGHGVLVHEQLKEKCCVDLFATSKHITDILFMSDLEMMLSRKKYELIIFNNGLHGMNIEDDLYAPALREALTYLKTVTPNLAWRNSTPAIKWPAEGDKGEPNDRSPRILRRNADALEVVKELGLPVIDLYSAIGHDPEMFSDGVHHTDAGKDIQVKILCDFISRYIK